MARHICKVLLTTLSKNATELQVKLTQVIKLKEATLQAMKLVIAKVDKDSDHVNVRVKLNTRS